MQHRKGFEVTLLWYMHNRTNAFDLQGGKKHHIALVAYLKTAQGDQSFRSFSGGLCSVRQSCAVVQLVQFDWWGFHYSQRGFPSLSRNLCNNPQRKKRHGKVQYFPVFLFALSTCTMVKFLKDLKGEDECHVCDVIYTSEGKQN